MGLGLFGCAGVVLCSELCPSFFLCGFWVFGAVIRWAVLCIMSSRRSILSLAVCCVLVWWFICVSFRLAVFLRGGIWSFV